MLTLLCGFVFLCCLCLLALSALLVVPSYKLLKEGFELYILGYARRQVSSLLRPELLF